ncbi:hypothetical protein RHAL8_00779 [Beijerinckiaceae bacterium RH AL8]|nr:hypothetical protein RHAL8_00779 [Beijerinckiaceae bacterium RH AL8]
MDADASANTVAEGAAAGTTVGVTASSTDVNGPAVIYAITNDTSGGGFAVDATTGVVTVADPTKIDYETSPGHAYSVTVAASDGTLTSAQTFAIAVTDVAPSTPVDADATANSVVEGAVAGTYTGLTASSTDPNGPAVTYSITADTSNGGFAVDATTGAVTIANPTKIDYETSAGHAYDVTVQASDSTLSSAQTFVINVVDAPPSAPVDADATANQVSTNAPQGSPTGITASSMDPNGGTVTYALTNDDGGHFEIDPTTGVVTVGATPVVYDPTTPANDTRTITVQAADSSGLASTADFTITVVQNTPPVANADNITATEAGGTNNATPGHDPSGNVVTGTGGNGEVADTDQQDPSTALVVVSAGPGATAGSNDIPVASTGSTIAGSHGELTIATDGSYAYTVAQSDPAVNALNPTQTLTDTFHYTIQDTGGLQSSAAITVTIHGADDAPTAHADAVSATEAGGVNNAIPGTNPSFNVVTGANETIATGADTDPDNGDTLTVVGVAAGTTAAFLAAGANADIAGTYGTIHINTDGSSTYTVNQAAANGLAAGQSATDTFSYTVQDSGGLDSTTQVTVTVNGANDAPTANPDTATATEAGGTANGTPGANGTGNVLTNDIDPDTGDTLTVQGVEAGSHPAAMVSGNVGSGVAGQYGTITVNGDGTYSYAVNNANATVDALNAGQHLTDTFTYTIHDNGGLTSTSTVAVTINGADDAPVAFNDSATVTSGMQASVNLLDNDTDVDTPHANLNAVVNAQPSHGSVVVNANGTFTYTASNGYIGADSFTYHDSDGTLSSNVATVNVTVQASVAYIDNDYTAARSGTLGSFTNPYSSVSAFNANNDAAHGYNIVYVENGTGSYAASGATIALRAGQYLEGQGVDPYYIDGSGNKVVLQDLDNTATPTLNYTTAGTGVTLGGNNTIAGLNFTGNGTAGQSAITGSNIANLAIDHVSVLGFGSAGTDAEINLNNLTGTASLTNSTIGYATNTNAAGGYGILIANTTGVLNLTGSDNTISNVISKTITAAGFEVSTSNAATATVALQHSTFQNNGNGFYGNAAGSSTLNVNLSGTAGQEATTGNTFISIDNDPTLKFFANVSLNSTDNAALNFNVNNNAQIIGGGIVVNGTGNSTFQGRMDGNVDIEAGSGNNTTAGLNAQVAENAQGIVDISNNTFSPITTDITVASQGDNDPAGSFTSRIDATIVNNKFTFYNPDGTFPGDGAIQIDSFTPNGATTDRSYVVADIRNNAVNDTSTSANAFYDTAFTDGQGYQSTGAHVYLKGFTTDGATTLQANNNTVNNPNTFYYYNQSNDSASDQGTNGPDGPEAIPTAAPFNGTVRTPQNPTALLAGSGGVQAATPTAGETHLSQAELNATVAAAIAVWQKAGLSADQVAHLESVSYQVGDTMGGWLGESTPGHVVIGPDAGGQGWYIDPATGPSAFAGPAGVTHLTADPTSAAAGHYDLLTTVVHEMGEQLGLQDNFDAAASGSLTSGLLSEGVRELPSATDVAEANALGTPAAPSLPEQKVVAQPLATQPVAAQQVAIEHHGNPAHVGHDTFVFDAKVLADASGPAKLVAHVADYSAAQHDTLDFTALFAATPRPAAHAADLVHATEDPGGHAATVAVNVAATGAAPHWVDIAHLDGVPQDATIDVAVDAAHPHHISHIHVGGLA